jgi:hypothetical protein
VTVSGAGVRLRPSRWLLSSFGGAVAVQLVQPGTRLEAHQPFGVVSSARDACHLRAPVGLTVTEVDVPTGELRARLEGPLSEELLSEEAYAAWARSEA